MKNTGKTAFAGLVLFVAATALLIYFIHGGKTASPLPKSFTSNGGTYNFTAYAYNLSTAEKGLMNATVTNSTLMLFAFNSSGIYPFWMKNTYYPLDIFWVYATSKTSGRIVYAITVQPCIDFSANQTSCPIYIPTSKANYVIEAHAGFLKSQGISQYDNITFNYN